MVTLVLLSLFLELVLYFVTPVWRLRRPIAIINLLLIGFVSGGVFAWYGFEAATIITIINLFRMLNMLRIVEGRMHEAYLKRATRRTGLILGILISLSVLLGSVQIDIRNWLASIVWVQLGVSVLLLVITIRNIHKTRHQPQLEHYADKELPTVSVLVPARNETNDLELCLRSLIASDYPKLEIIVLDDCSQDKTSEVIRQFAHDGVRFIKGEIPESRWLAKNQAYERLRSEASGELVLFCGVDVRFGPQSIRALVTTMLNRKKQMISVLPRRLDSSVLAAFIQPMRYWWELALPRRLFNRPPVLSTCWIINNDTLDDLGGFAAVSHSILPETYFARELVKKNDSYSFIRSDEVLDIQTAKSIQGQRETAIRTRYPQLKRRPENILLMTVLETMFLLSPFVLLLLSLINALDISILLLAISCGLLIATHLMVVAVSNPSNVPVALFNFPFVVITEIVLSLTSMLKYEFSEVDWKGRNICIPVMHVIPQLPKA